MKEGMKGERKERERERKSKQAIGDREGSLNLMEMDGIVNSSLLPGCLTTASNKTPVTTCGYLGKPSGQCCLVDITFRTQTASLIMREVP